MDHLHNTAKKLGTILKLLSWSELRKVVPLSRSTVWRRVRDGRFPAPLQISPGRVAWREDDIRAWMAAQKRVP
jgi:predicted DNA-binding transcriptional regulator AlpA